LNKTTYNESAMSSLDYARERYGAL
jgi:hypothetical protein